MKSNTINSIQSPDSINVIKDDRGLGVKTDAKKTSWEKTQWVRWALTTGFLLLGLYLSYLQIYDR